MSNKLPNFIDPIYAVQHNKQFVASVNQALFPRLCEHLASHEHVVDVAFNFYYDKVLRLRSYTLVLKTKMNLVCQRSLKAFDFTCETKVTGAFVETLKLSDDLPSEIEIYELDEEDEKISLHDLIEDELLLCVPLAPINEKTVMDYEQPEEPEELEQELQKKPNPFAALQGLKSN